MRRRRPKIAMASSRAGNRLVFSWEANAASCMIFRSASAPILCRALDRAASGVATVRGGWMVTVMRGNHLRGKSPDMRLNSV